MEDRLIHPMFQKSSRSARPRGPWAAAIAFVLAAVFLLTLLLAGVERVSVDAVDQSLRPVPGFGL
jgi:hypothetical protein